MGRRFWAVLPLLLAGCAVTQEDCVSTDWRQQGLEDGFDGLVARSGYWVSQCQPHGVKVDSTAYSRGWGDGNRQYCTSEQGYRHGTLGHSYQGVCPADTEEAFLNSYNKGLRLYEKAQYRESLYDRQRDIRWRISDIDSRLNDAKLSPQTRDSLRWERQQLTYELMHIDSLLLRSL